MEVTATNSQSRDEDDAMAASKREAWRNAPIAMRLKKISEIFIRHKAVRDILQYIEQQLVINAARGMADGALIIAESGTGKTTTIKYLKQIYPDVVTPTLTTKPVVVFDLPKKMTPKGLGEAMLKALGDPAYRSGDASEKFERIETLLIEIGTVIIAVDNFQDIPAKRRQRGIEQISIWFRDLCSLKFPGIVLAFGTEAAAVVRDSEVQLRRRMQARFELPTFSFKTADGYKRWVSLLRDIEKQLPLADHSPFADKQLATRIGIATAGNFDYLMKLLEKAVIAAVSRGVERIEMQDLQLAFERQHQVAAEGGNPFMESFTAVSLDGPGQVFYDSSKGDAKSGART